MTLDPALPDNLPGWLAYIEAGHPTEIELGLERSRAVADALGLLTPMPAVVITVAGTNGKGSTLAFMGAILTAAGYRWGGYTSPHFLHYNERVVINGVPVADGPLCEAFAAIEQVRRRLAVSLTYFEFGTLAALLVFRREPLDMVLLEVGLGGRLDAVNIIDPNVAVVTTVALDHQDWLGDDREQIGREKAGIFRSGRPAVIGESEPPASLLDYARGLGVEPLCRGADFGSEPAGDGDGAWHWFGRDSRGQPVRVDNLPAPQLPPENAATALQALYLSGLVIEKAALIQGVARARLTGRLQRIDYRGRHLILDVAHNPQAAAHLARRLGDGPDSADRPRWCVLGMLADKDSRGCIAALALVVDHWCIATLKVPRGQSAAVLADQVRELSPQTGCDEFAFLSEAFEAAIGQSPEGSSILVVGSFVTVADTLAGLEMTP